MSGYAVVSLFNVFGSSLVDREKLKTKYNPQGRYDSWENLVYSMRIFHRINEI